MIGPSTVLRGVIVAGLAAGAFALVRPPVRGRAEPPVVELAAAQTLPTAAPASDSLAMEVVLANLFAANRTPPRRRYTPVDSGASVDGEPAAADSLPSVSGLAMPIPALYGTVVNDGVSVQALLHLSASTPGPRLYTVGARDGGYRVVSIAPRVVVLLGPQGRVVLRLSPTAEVRP
jgi:hypothetical protein